ncbi:MAG: Mur ligase domain-containing protein [Candidatus Saccharimonadales bacterium]
MHIFFSGIGGTAIGPLAMIAHRAGYQVSGSDKQDSQYIDYLKSHGVGDLHIGQTKAAIAAVQQNRPIDWFVYSSAVAIENQDGPELTFCREHKIKTSKRDELLNEILLDKKLKMIAVAGTHGKTTTTAMVIWLFKQLDVPLSYSVGAKIDFGEMGEYDKNSEYFAYEADEFDRNFLSFRPHLSLISGVSYDHHEIFKSRQDYQAAFREFIAGSGRTILWHEDYEYLKLEAPTNLMVQDSASPLIELMKLKGRYNRLDAWLAVQAVHQLTKTPLAKLIEHINKFPGVQRRLEQIIPNLYSDEAHTPDKIRGGLSAALETAAENQKVIVVYEPLTNRRQHYMLTDYQDCFDGAAKVYWLPSYLAREDPNQRVIKPSEMVKHLADPRVAEPMERGDKLKKIIQEHLDAGDMVVGMAGGGGNSLDEWLRQEFANQV